VSKISQNSLQQQVTTLAVTPLWRKKRYLPPTFFLSIQISDIRTFRNVLIHASYFKSGRHGLQGTQHVSLPYLLKRRFLSSGCSLLSHTPIFTKGGISQTRHWICWSKLWQNQKEIPSMRRNRNCRCPTLWDHEITYRKRNMRRLSTARKFPIEYTIRSTV
jgi:hypothetical protein